VVKLQLPEEYNAILQDSMVCAFTVKKPNGRLSTHPTLPLYDEESGKIYLTCSLLFSKKAEYVKSDGKVALLFYNREWTGGRSNHEILVQGDAKVLEDDVHAGWERLIPLWVKKEPYITELLKGRSAFPLFWERIMIEVDPKTLHVWRDGDVSKEPEVFRTGMQA
jgi:general stress protein 26